VRIEEFDYELPEELIATEAAEPRDHSRLLIYRRDQGTIEHRHFYDLVDYLTARDTLVLNNTRVIQARLFGESDEKRRFEVFLLKSKPETPHLWECLARPGKKIKGPTRLHFADGMQGILSREGADGAFSIQFKTTDISAFQNWLARNGQSPLPPYIKRPFREEDKDRYQTVYAKHLGSVAAPTAGLHFTPSLLQQAQERGVTTAEVTLHVGYGTFSPVREENIDAHVMHEETYFLDKPNAARLQEAEAEQRRLIAVGTTSLRTLESLPDPLGPTSGSTQLFISPGYSFRRVGGLITNFHLPKSTLFILVASLMGLEAAHRCYTEAIRERYRFYSFGDAMLIL